ncbi:MAG: OmpA family protein [Acidimicrobiales bacterium]
MAGSESTPSRQELIALADQVASSPERPSGTPKWLIAAGLGVVALMIVALVLVLGGNDDDKVGNATASTVGDPATSVASPTTEAATETTAAVETTEDTTPATTAETVPATTAETTPATTPETTPETVPATTVAVGPATFSDPVRWAEFSDGKVYLRGTVPDQATADEIRDKAAAVVGADNVFVEYAIVAGAPRPESAPLYVRDSVLFARNSVDINATARGVLDLGVVLMNQNPQITIDISGHTDSDGTDEMNLQLSQRRVQVIFDYLVSQGIDPARLTTAAYGESQPIADNATAEGRALNRRVEFQINNLLG